MITVLGALGFIGSHLVTELAKRNANHFAPARDEKLPQKNLGDVIYCIGITADFRTKPFETVEAHVCKLLEVLRNSQFDSLTYLSSTRVYANHPGPAKEDDPLLIAPLNKSDFYNISKAMGESLSLNSGRNARVVRLANVYGADFGSENFLTTIIKDAIATGKVTLKTAADSAKDYVSIEDVVDGLLEIATCGRQRIYNLASGKRVSNGELAARLSEVTNCQVEFVENASRVSFPSIAIDRMSEEFAFQPSSVLDDLDGLVSLYREMSREQE